MNSKFPVNFREENPANTPIVPYNMCRKHFTKCSFRFLGYMIVIQPFFDILLDVFPIGLVEICQISFEKRNIASTFFNTIYRHSMIG